jgi:hypothetical protein
VLGGEFRRAVLPVLFAQARSPGAADDHADPSCFSVASSFHAKQPGQPMSCCRPPLVVKRKFLVFVPIQLPSSLRNLLVAQFEIDTDSSSIVQITLDVLVCVPCRSHMVPPVLIRV